MRDVTIPTEATQAVPTAVEESASGSRGRVLLPIQNVQLPGGVELELSGLTAVVGPNSSGKTQLLRDINAAICGQPRPLAVAKRISYQKPVALDSYLAALVESGDLLERKDGGSTRYRKVRHQFGVNDGSGGEYLRSDLQANYNLFAEHAAHSVDKELPNSPFLQMFGGLTCSALFLETRLFLLQDTANFDHLSASPANLIQALFLERTARELLERETLDVFGRCVWIDYTRANLLSVLASDVTERPSAEDRLYPSEMRKYRPLSSEGDGLRSYAAVCATLLLSQRPLCLIDEPELCLHPPQAYAMGRFIGTYAKKNGRGTVVSTHSSHVLRGMLDAGAGVSVVRLVRTKGKFLAHGVKPALLARALQNPRSRAEVALDGLFADGVVLCESEGDRVVYSAAHRKLDDRAARDLRFVPSFGLPGMPELVRLYRSLHVPVVTACDVDILTKEELTRSLCGAFELPSSDSTRVLTLARDLVAYLKSKPAITTEEQLILELQAICARTLDWSRGDDLKVKEELRQISDRLSRLRSIKRTGLSALPDGLRTEGAEVLKLLKAVGFFVVPVGELESWMPMLLNGVGRNDKAAWAGEAARRIEDANLQQIEDIASFVTEMDKYLAKVVQEWANSES